MAEEFNLAVFLVNQCQADPGGMSVFAPVVKPVRPSLPGLYLYVYTHEKTNRITTTTDMTHKPTNAPKPNPTTGGRQRAGARLLHAHPPQEGPRQPACRQARRLGASLAHPPASICLVVIHGPTSHPTDLPPPTPLPSSPQPSMPEAEAPFALTDGGVADV